MPKELSKKKIEELVTLSKRVLWRHTHDAAKQKSLVFDLLLDRKLLKLRDRIAIDSLKKYAPKEYDKWVSAILELELTGQTFPKKKRAKRRR